MKYNFQLLSVVLATTASDAAVLAYASAGIGAATGSTASRQTSDQACGLVADAQGRGELTIAPSMALDCLNSVDLDVERDTALVD